MRYETKLEYEGSPDGCKLVEDLVIRVGSTAQDRMGSRQRKTDENSISIAGILAPDVEMKT